MPPAKVSRTSRMRLEALEFLERRQIRVGVVEMQDEADRHQIVVEVIEERAAAGGIVERPAEGMLHQPLRCFSGATCHSSFRPMPNFCGSRPSVEIEFLEQLLAEMPRAPSANSVYLPRSSMPRVKLSFGSPFLPTPMSPVAIARDGAVFVVENLGGGKARIDLDAERFRLARKPAADIAERDDVVAVVAHQRRHQDIRQPQRGGGGEVVETDRP